MNLFSFTISFIIALVVVSIMIFRLSRPLYSLEELAKKNLNKKQTFFSEGQPTGRKVVSAFLFLGASAVSGTSK